MQVKNRLVQSAYACYQKKRLDFEKQIKCEQDYLVNLQHEIAEVVSGYMQEEKIGFNELVRRLDMSPTKVSNIRKSKANLTLASVARLFALLNKEPGIKVK